MLIYYGAFLIIIQVKTMFQTMTLDYETDISTGKKSKTTDHQIISIGFLWYYN